MNVHTMRLATRACLAIGLLAAAAAEAQVAPPPDVLQDGSTCKNLAQKGIRMRRVEYVPLTWNTDPNDGRSTCFFGLCKIQMMGLLYYPVGEVRNAPAIIYTHGHNRERGEPCAIVEQFVKKGYVVFAPLRRGHVSATPSTIPPYWEPISSTGLYIDDWASLCLSRDCAGCVPFDAGTCLFPDLASSCNMDSLQIANLEEQSGQEVPDQLDWLLAQPGVTTTFDPTARLVDPTRTVLLGHSYGGSLVVMANSLDLPHTAMIAVSPGALQKDVCWDEAGDPWRKALESHAARATRPFYVLQARNEGSTRT